jgi:hypothetical protein
MGDAGRWDGRRGAIIALLALVSFAAQALLVTFAPPVYAAPKTVAHSHHRHDGVAAPHEHAPPTPADDSHHRGFCCILGGKLGTALGPIASPPAGLERTAFRLIIQPTRARVVIIPRLAFGSLGARAPPLAS